MAQNLSFGGTPTYDTSGQKFGTAALQCAGAVATYGTATGQNVPQTFPVSFGAFIKSSSATTQWRRALVPGPFAGEPARLLWKELGLHRSRSLQTLSLVAAYGWPLGLVASHLVHSLALIVGVAWAALSLVALSLRTALHQAGSADGAK